MASEVKDRECTNASERQECTPDTKDEIITNIDVVHQQKTFRPNCKRGKERESGAWQVGDGRRKKTMSHRFANARKQPM